MRLREILQSIGLQENVSESIGRTFEVSHTRGIFEGQKTATRKAYYLVVRATQTQTYQDGEETPASVEFFFARTCGTVGALSEAVEVVGYMYEDREWYRLVVDMASSSGGQLVKKGKLPEGVTIRFI